MVARPRRSVTDLSVNIKILMAVALAALVALLVGALGLSALSDASGSARKIYRTNLPSVTEVAGVATATADGARSTQQAAGDLTRLASDLTTLVGSFRH